MDAMPVQEPANPAGPAQSRARFFNSGNAFNVKLPPVPAAVFPAAAVPVLGAATGFVLCDQSESLALPYPATTPLMLARYAAIAPNADLTARFKATGAIWYVIAGAGTSTIENESFDWSSGDVFLSPGGVELNLRADREGAVLWVVTNEPQLAFDYLQPAHGEECGVDVVHYPALEIRHQLERVVNASRDEDTAGLALIFSSERNAAGRNILPSLTLSLNTLPSGERQRKHRHNSAAVTLILSGRRCYSIVGAERCDWSQYATLVTPPAEPHSHHNDGDERALFLIVQDGGLHYHARTMGFAFLEPEA
jgi:gentisate 1,2-dioxygenase